MGSILSLIISDIDIMLQLLNICICTSKTWDSSEQPVGGAAVLSIHTLGGSRSEWCSVFLHCSLPSHPSMHLNIHCSWRSSLLGRSSFQYFNIQEEATQSVHDLTEWIRPDRQVAHTLRRIILKKKLQFSTNWQKLGKEKGGTTAGWRCFWWAGGY